MDGWITTTEWGVRTPDGKLIPCRTQFVAERMANMLTVDGLPYRPGAEVVCREVSDWHVAARQRTP